MFTGNYRGKQLHRCMCTSYRFPSNHDDTSAHYIPATVADIEEVIARAKSKGVEKMIITGTSLKESRVAVEMGRQYGGYVSPDPLLTVLSTLIL